MSDLTDLYQEVILDHNKRPRNYGPMKAPDRQARGHNPLCGDLVTVFVRLNGPLIEDVRFEGSGCAISKASASLMTEAVRGRSTADALSLLERFQTALTTPPDQATDSDSLGKLAALIGVREFPMRVKCATLAWHALRSALSASSQPAATE